MAEQKKYDVIKGVVDHGGNKNRAVIELGCTRRTVDRLVCGYRDSGKAYFSHGNKGRKPVTEIPAERKKDILDLYNTKYDGCNYEFFTELLRANERIRVSVGTVRNILMGERILSPKAKRATKKAVKKELEEKKKATESKRKKDEIEKKLVSIEFAHPRRPRCANFGEELQMDASVFRWFGDTDSQLHAAIDDATGKITGAYFDWQKTYCPQNASHTKNHFHTGVIAHPASFTANASIGITGIRRIVGLCKLFNCIGNSLCAGPKTCPAHKPKPVADA
jgi:hypothetical protein